MGAGHQTRIHVFSSAPRQVLPILKLKVSNKSNVCSQFYSVIFVMQEWGSGCGQFDRLVGRAPYGRSAYAPYGRPVLEQPYTRDPNPKG